MAARPSKSIAAATPPPSEAGSCSSLWSHLPPELAGLVLRRFSSLADRVRFASVCRHWRHASRQQAPVLPPVFPWTIAFGTVQTIPDGEVHCLFSRTLALCWRSSESWLLMIGRVSSDDTKIRNFLKNPVSGATLPLPGTGNLLDAGGWLYGVTKFIMCPDNLVIATMESSVPPNLIACCRPGMSSWSMSSQATAATGAGYEDIAFKDGTIYAITKRGDLFAHEVRDECGHIVLSYVKLVIKGGDTSFFSVRRFLVVSRGDKLLMVKWNYGRGRQTYH